MQQQNFHPLKAFYMATLGNAKALGLDDNLGNFAPGKDADFIVLDVAATPIQALRQSHAHSLAEQLFALMTLGDEHNVARTYILGELAFMRAARRSEDLLWTR